jgi:DNA-binding MarR family transcriptional regulator
MYDTRNVDVIAAGLLDLMGCMNSPRQDEVLLAEAGVSLDRALFPLLVALGRDEAMAVARLADRVGRDASTVSRQLAKLEQLGLVRRPAARGDQRVREAAITKAGARTLAAITEARRRLLGQLVQDWSADERGGFAALMQKFADAMKQRHRAAVGG